MNTQNKYENEYIPVSQGLSLTVRKEHRLMVIKKFAKTAFSVLWRAVLYAFILTMSTVIF